MSDDENEEYMLNAERAAKQRYLSEEVIDLSYDPNLFMDFISKVKDPDIDLWTFEELQEIVRKFKSKYRPGDTLDAPKPAPVVSEPVHNPPPAAEKKVETKQAVSALASQEVIKKEEAKKEEVKKEEVKREEVKIEEIKQENGVLKTKDLEKTGLFGRKDLQVKVSEPQVTGGGIFSKKYVLYTITTDPLGWVVRRRYSDFEWLRSTLLTITLCSYLPPLPEKKTSGNLEEKTIKKRQQFLNQFMVVLIKDQVMLGTLHVEMFLREADESKFKKYVKSQKIKKPDTIYQTLNLNGEALVEYGELSKVYDPQEKYINLAEAITKKIKHKCSALMETEKRLSDSLKKYAEGLKELQEAQLKIPNNQNNLTVCGALNDSILKWSDHETENILGINGSLRIPFSYTHKEMEILKEMLKERKSVYSNYRSLEAKQRPDKPRDALDRSKEMFGYFNAKTKDEVERVLNDETELSIKHFKQTGMHQEERVQKYQTIWSNLAKSLSSLN